MNRIDAQGDTLGIGYISYKRRNEETGLENQCWKDSRDSISCRYGQLPGFPRATCELQGYAYDAKMRGARLARAVWNDPEYADQLERKADELKHHFSRDSWVEGGEYYALALDADGRQVDALSSNIGHLLWSGIVDESRAPTIAGQQGGPRLFSGWGVRTLAEGEGRYNAIGYHVGTTWPFDNSFIAWGLQRYGFKDEAAQVASRILDAAAIFDGRLPEAFGRLEVLTRAEGAGDWHVRVSTRWLGHLVDRRRHREDHGVVLAGCDLHAIGVPDPEPLLGHLRDPIAAVPDAVFVFQDVALHVELGSVGDADHPAVTERRDQRLLYHRDAVAAGPLNLHAVLDAQHPLLDLAELAPLCIREDQRLPDAQRLAVDLEDALTPLVLDLVVVPDGKHALAHLIAVRVASPCRVRVPGTFLASSSYHRLPPRQSRVWVSGSLLVASLLPCCSRPPCSAAPSRPAQRAGPSG